MTEDATTAEAIEEEPQVEVEAEASEETEVAEGGEEQKEEIEAQDSSPKPEKDNIQKRIDELTAARRQAERQAEHYRQLAERQQAEPYTPDKTLADFDYDEQKYQQYLYQDAENRARTEFETVQREQARRRVISDFQDKADRYAAENGIEDYDRVARDQRLPIHGHLLGAVVQSDHGPAVLYHLGQNPDMAWRLAQSDPLTIGREIALLEAKLTAPKQPSVSKAPEPAPTIKPAATKVQKGLNDLSQKEFEERRRKYIAQNR